MIRTRDQIVAALALIALDGVARRIVLCTPDLAAAHIPHVLETAEVDAVISDYTPDEIGGTPMIFVGHDRPDDLMPAREENEPATEWILFTSGTTGRPKMVVHTLNSLAGPLERIRALGPGAIWSTFYDIRRYGGLQILLRALIGGGSIVLSAARETTSAYLARVAANHVTHITGTPSHWRQALMNPAAKTLSPLYARMSGEVADQAIIDKLRAFYPGATVAHAFASTEAGLAFDVNDGKAGFPAGLVGDDSAAIAIRLIDGSMRIRSGRTAARYLGAGAPPLRDAEEFVDTGDIIERRGDRCYFAGRKEGIINVGGLKVHPEEVEAIINQHPDVEMSLVRSRANPITGAIVVADVVRKPPVEKDGLSPALETDELRQEILQLCRERLPPYKVPASIRVVTALDVGVSGKLSRVRA